MKILNFPLSCLLVLKILNFELPFKFVMTISWMISVS